MIFAATLLQWFKNNGRSLPWRETKDAYAIWLSEVILQQTRIAQGMSYWERFMAQWPTVNDLAAATEDEVLKAWQGLGYYSRARNLHTAAQQVVELGGFPQTFKELKTLKGVGDYTAAAIASIAFGEPVAVVDGNVYRVLSRYFGIDTPIDSTEGKKEFQVLAQSLLPINEPADYNEAIMDFGATQCTPNSPHCSACPFCETCVAFREQRINELPVKSKKVKQRERHFTYLYIEYEGKIAIHQRGAGDIWQGLWEFPQAEQLTSSEDSAWRTEAQLLQKGVKHILTHQILLADIYLWRPKIRPQLPSEFIWIEKQDLENYALPRLIEILLKAVPA
ncbi:A/G-specific adenine glycosylase [Prevotella melaninogenica]|uniref:A/G-specific adenine glycosylase n=1 Tax=Prevotella melaninogenica TaxID=28132 RepID=UPI001D14772B|nr:A/G-specific adenine glycosylase [Prevotella melaninogenica]UEA99926.1 A/G-specific adenine glycosylase [Prevotella melaninogenica]